ncbi:hypothetical protein [Flavobacterium sasangense]|uniref:hypothetical protein n=1 Tax=Flavobacterium sasangense TaxID=503361 RepID=UPI00047A448C|nr:hypothetical protein [Flavobacterium sasangense]
MRNNNSENPKELSLKDKISFIQNYQRTFKNWESNYQNRVIEFINQYEDNSENIFIENEIENAENVLLQLGQALKDNYIEKDSIDLLDTNPMRDLYIDLRIESTIKSKSTYKKIKAFLEQRKIELKQPQQIEIKPQESKTIEAEKVEIKPQEHTDYFKDNAFEIWERLFENFNIDKTKRTDLRFMYEIMKHNGQIHKTVTVKSITDWINETYDFGIDKLQYTNIKSKSNENRMSIYNLIK